MDDGGDLGFPCVEVPFHVRSQADGSGETKQHHQNASLARAATLVEALDQIIVVELKEGKDP